jgi:TatD DNase family protein
MKLVDTHCHIQSVGITSGEDGTHQLWAKAPELTVDKIIANATEADVTKLICVGCDLEDSRLAIDFANKHENTWATIGIHPHEAKKHTDGVLQDQFSQLVSSPKVVAVGECGLDYFYNHSPKEDQIKLLRFQIELALEHDLPLVFHVREAFLDFWPIFDDYQGIRGVIHSFSAGKAEVDEILSRNLYIGINGIVTFTKRPEQLEAVKHIPLTNLVLETDAPYLTPTPYRGTICEPKHVRVTAEFIANLRSVSLDQIALSTSTNANNLFRLKEE